MISAGMVNAYFHARSHHKCMKKNVTNVALATETAIIDPQANTGFSISSECAIQKESPVKAVSITNTVANTPTGD